MIADCLSGPRLVAMALLLEGWEKDYHTRPAIDQIVCAGQILSHERLIDGRYNVLLQGVARARVKREFGDKPYRVAELEPLVETPVMEIDLADDRRRLTAIVDEERFAATGVGKQFRQLVKGATPTTTLVDLIAFNLLEDVKLKQSLLGERDVRRRVTRTVDALESLHSVLQAAAPAPFSKDSCLN